MKDIDDYRRPWKIVLYDHAGRKRGNQVTFFGTYDECEAYAWSICGLGGNIEIILQSKSYAKKRK